MLYSLRLFIKDRWNILLFFASLAFQALSWIYVILNIKPTAEQIFLHYNVEFGVDLIGDWWKIYYLPLAGAVVFILNYFLSLYFYSSDRVLARVFGVFTFFFQVFLFTAIYLIIGKNI